MTLHDLDGRSGIELGLAADAVFDADGRSIWLLRGGSLFRIEADGREYEIGLPVPARGRLAPHPGGKLVVIVGEIDSRALLVDARGVVERIWAAERVVWAPGGQRYAYRAVDGWYMASLRSGQRTWLGAIVLDARWSADGRHLALLTRPHRSDGIVSRPHYFYNCGYTRRMGHSPRRFAWRLAPKSNGRPRVRFWLSVESDAAVSSTCALDPDYR